MHRSKILSNGAYCDKIAENLRSDVEKEMLNFISVLYGQFCILGSLHLVICLTG